MCVHVVQSETPSLRPLAHQTGADDHLYMECQHCNVVVVSRTNWEGSHSYLIIDVCLSGDFSQNGRWSVIWPNPAKFL